jgi:hypothetical protein
LFRPFGLNGGLGDFGPLQGRGTSAENQDYAEYTSNILSSVHNQAAFVVHPGKTSLVGEIIHDQRSITKTNG